MRSFIKNFINRLLFPVSLLLFFSITVNAQKTGDFQSINTGLWTDVSIWQVFDGTSWLPATSYPGQFGGDYTVNIQQGNTVTISNTGISTNPMGELIIDGKLALTGKNNQVNFFLNTPLIFVTGGLSPEATIEFNQKSALTLPANGVIEVWTGGLSVDCNHNQDIFIGTVTYATCNGAPGSIFTFDELMQAGGTLNAIETTPPYSCLGQPVQLTGNYSGAIGTSVTYKWSSTGPTPLNFDPSGSVQSPSVTPEVPGEYSISLTVSTTKGTIVYSNTEKVTLIVPPSSSTIYKSVCSSDLPYSWLGKTYSTAGTYNDTLTNTAGCDSIVTLNLIVKQPSFSSSNVSVCSSDLPYSWLGKTYSTAGTYNDTLTNAAGCDSIITLKLNILQSSTSITKKTVCSSELPYVWHGVNYSTTGIYNDTLTNAAGCDSIATLQLTECANSIPQCPITTSDIRTCPNTNTQLHASGVDYYFWSPSAGLSDTTIANPVVNVPTSRKYVVTGYTEAKTNLIANGDFEAGNTGFSTSYTYTNQKPYGLKPEGNYTVDTNPNSYHPNFSACSDHTSGTGKMMIINGNTSPNITVWSQSINVQPNKDYAFYAYVTTVYPTNPPILQFSINGKTLGNPYSPPGNTCNWYKFYALWNSGTATTANISIVNNNTIANGNDFAIDDIKYVELCKSTDTVFVNVGPYTSTTNITVCSSELPYRWNGADYSTSGTYTYNTYNNIGCDSTAVLNLTVNPSPTVTNTSLTQTICSGTSTTFVTLTSNVDSATFEWTASTNTGITGFTSSGTNTIPEQTLINPDHSTAGTVTYVITPKANGCTGPPVNYVITVDPKPVTSDIFHQ